jgi:hypothetical protein
MTDPKFYGGISNTFNFKGISLDVFFQFTKQMGRNPMTDFVKTAGAFNNNLPKEYFSRWQKPNDVSNIQKLYATISGAADYNGAADQQLGSDFVYVDASFIRLKNLSVSYTVPEIWRQKLRLQGLRFYLQGQNLWTVTPYKGLDPETKSNTTLPPLRIMTAGIQITL